MTYNRDIPFAKSLVDYIFRWMGMEFIPGYRAANAPKRPGAETPAPKIEPIVVAPPIKEPEVVVNRIEAEDVAPRIREVESPANSNGNGNGHSNGNGNGHKEPEVAPRIIALDDPQIAEDRQVKMGPLVSITQQSRTVVTIAETQNAAGSAMVTLLNEANSALMGDAPACDVCGSITVRNGTCYRCLNCGNSMGCS